MYHSLKRKYRLVFDYQPSKWDVTLRLQIQALANACNAIESKKYFLHYDGGVDPELVKEFMEGKEKGKNLMMSKAKFISLGPRHFPCLR